MRMSTSDHDIDEEDWFEEEPDPQLPSFTVGLALAGDEGSSYRLRNDPAAPYQRDNYIERKSAIDIRCSSVDVIHGLSSTKADAFATLIVLDFRFDVRKRARRITSVDIILQFSGMRSGDNDPEVVSISPHGTLHLVPTARTEQVGHNANITLGGGAVVTASSTVGWEKSTSQELPDRTVVIGSIDLIGRNHGKKNCASWTMLENKSQASGVPTYMRAAILLKRRDEKPFKCFAKINAKADFKSSMERVFGKKDHDDPVLFDPQLEPTNKLQEYDLDNLGALDLEKLSDLTFATVLQGVMKERTLGE